MSDFKSDQRLLQDLVIGSGRSVSRPRFSEIGTARLRCMLRELTRRHILFKLFCGIVS